MMTARLFAGILLAGILLAQQPETVPAFGKAKPFAVPATQTFKLKNGADVTLAPYGNVPLVSVSARISFGHLNESADQVWLTDFLTQLMQEGTTTRTGQQVAQEAARMGGQLSFNAGDDESSIDLEVLSEFAPDAVKLISDVVENPKLPADQMERIRANLLRQLSVQLATPRAQANQAYAAALYPNHPYGRLFPAEAQLKGYTLENVKGFYAANIGAQRTRLYVAGKFDSAAVRTAIEGAYSNWNSGPPVQQPAPEARPGGGLVMVDRPGAVQSTLRIGRSIDIQPGAKDYIAMDVTDALLGGAFTSRITQNIREAKGYTYSPFSVVRVRQGAVSWTESADVTTKFTADSIREIRSEVDRLRKEPPSNEELKGVQNYLDGVFILMNSSNSGIIQQLDFVNRFGLDPSYLKNYVAGVDAVTRQDIQRLAETYLDFKKMTVVVVGDQSQVGASLKEFGPLQHQ